MRERLVLDEIHCDGCVSRLVRGLAPVAGINDTRVDIPSSSVVIDYDDSQREALDAAITGADFRIVTREAVAADA